MRCSTVLRILFALVLLFAITPVRAAELAVLPYRIDNPSANFPESMGGEYSRLLGIASLLIKEDIELTPPREIDIDLEKMKISSRDVITKDDLDLLGRTRRIDYFMVGSLARRGGTCISESVLYSVREGRVIARARVEDGDLLRLAGKEIREALVTYRNKKTARETGEAGAVEDVLFLVDLSYLVNADWSSVKNAVVGYAAACIDNRRADTRVYIVPFSDRLAYAAASVSVNSITAVRGELDKLKPAGGAGAEHFIRSLKYALNSVRWRNGARTMIVISNSSFTSRGVETYGVMARKKGIVIHAVSLGRIPGDRSEVMDRLASANGGIHAHASYHQRLFNAGGEPVEVFMENGRLFRSRYPDRDWKNGLYEPGSRGRRNGKPKQFLDEIFYSEKGLAVDPYALPQSYARITMERIINQDPLENNIEALVCRASGAAPKRGAPERGRIGRALLSDGKISFWVDIADTGFMEYFENRRESGTFSLVGVTVKKDTSSAYGISLVPKLRGIAGDQIPRLVRADLGDIVRRADYYATRGLAYPPVWFVSVKVESAERARPREDVRD